MFATTAAVSDEEKDVLYRLRYQVFVVEQHKYKATANHRDRMLRDELDDVAEHLCLFQNDQIIGSLRQVRGREHASEEMWRQFGLEDFAAFPDCFFGFSGRLMLPRTERGSLGLVNLLQTNYERGRTAGAMFDFIMCNPHLVRLYEQLGYRRYKQHFFDPNHGYNVPMVFLADDVAHLQDIRSPFLPVAQLWPSHPEISLWFHQQFPHNAAITSAVTSPEIFSKAVAEKIGADEVPLLAEFSQDELHALFVACTRLHVDAGARLARQGDMGEELYIILEGSAETRAADCNPARQRVLGTYTRGDFFGELSVLTGNPRTNDIVAISDLDVLFFDRATLLKFMKRKPSLAAKLLLNMARVVAERLHAPCEIAMTGT